MLSVREIEDVVLKVGTAAAASTLAQAIHEAYNVKSKELAETMLRGMELRSGELRLPYNVEPPYESPAHSRGLGPNLLTSQRSKQWPAQAIP